MKKERKPDRRNRITIQILKDSFLALLNDYPYEKINVSLLCRKADITRSTFYLHYESLDELLDDVLNDAFLFNQNDGAQSVLKFKEGVSFSSTLTEITLPACQRVADSEKYKALLQDQSLEEHILRKIYLHEKENVVSALMKKTGLSEDDCNILFLYNLHGSFYVNRLYQWKKDQKRYHVLSVIDTFAEEGYEGLKKRNN